MSDKDARRRIMFENRSAQVPPIIRLKGQWLVTAGFIPGEHVEIIVTGPGEMVIRRPTKSTDDVAEAKARFLATCAKLGL